MANDKPLAEKADQVCEIKMPLPNGEKATLGTHINPLPGQVQGDAASIGHIWGQAPEVVCEARPTSAPAAPAPKGP